MKKHSTLFGSGYLCVTLRKCSCQLLTGGGSLWRREKWKRKDDSTHICIAWQLECENYWKMHRNFDFFTYGGILSV